MMHQDRSPLQRPLGSQRLRALRFPNGKMVAVCAGSAILLPLSLMGRALEHVIDRKKLAGGRWEEWRARKIRRRRKVELGDHFEYAYFEIVKKTLTTKGRIKTKRMKPKVSWGNKERDQLKARGFFPFPDSVSSGALRVVAWHCR